MHNYYYVYISLMNGINPHWHDTYLLTHPIRQFIYNYLYLLYHFCLLWLFTKNIPTYFSIRHHINHHKAFTKHNVSMWNIKAKGVQYLTFELCNCTTPKVGGNSFQWNRTMYNLPPFLSKKVVLVASPNGGCSCSMLWVEHVG